MNNLSSELQISRECALLGNYDSSLLYYESVLNTIKVHIKSIQDPLLKVSWTNTRLELFKEFNYIKEISQELYSFKERQGVAVHKTTGLWSDDGVGDSPISKRRNKSNGEIPGWAARLSTPSNQSKNTKKTPVKNTPKKTNTTNTTNTPVKQVKVTASSTPKNNSSIVQQKVQQESKVEPSASDAKE